MTIYRISDWEKWETTRSRAIEHPAFVATPLLLEDIRFLRLRRVAGARDAASAMGVYITLAMLQMRFGGNIRAGYITNNGRVDGVAYDATDIAAIVGFDEEIVAQALADLTAVGLLEAIEDVDIIAPRGRKTQGVCARQNVENLREGEKERGERRGDYRGDERERENERMRDGRSEGEIEKNKGGIGGGGRARVCAYTRESVEERESVEPECFHEILIVPQQPTLRVEEHPDLPSATDGETKQATDTPDLPSAQDEAGSGEAGTTTPSLPLATDGQTRENAPRRARVEENDVGEGGSVENATQRILEPFEPTFQVETDGQRTENAFRSTQSKLTMKQQPPAHLCFSFEEALQTPVYVRDGVAYADSDAITRWAIAYPKLDIAAELKRMSAWSFQAGESNRAWNREEWLLKATMWLTEESRKAEQRAKEGERVNRGAAGMPYGSYERTIEGIDKTERQITRRIVDITALIEDIKKTREIARQYGRDEEPYKKRIAECYDEIKQLEQDKKALHVRAIAAWRENKQQKARQQ